MNANGNTLTDYEFSYVDGLRRQATHRVRIFPSTSWTTIILTDMSDKYLCPSVTNSIEDLVNALLSKHREIQPTRVVLIEHYDHREARPRSVATGSNATEHETFDLVSFLSNQDGHLYEPDWKSITKARAEEWIGRPLP